MLPLGGQGKEEAIAALKRNNHELRRAVAKNVLTLKYVPELRYQIDETFDRLDETRRLFSDETVQRDVAAREDDAEGGKD